ncbi:MAG: hypothetical protein IPM54_44560 [Polyangiaceae bacterium]|nr:hypothetical protein [Polyangiaceae bacterium]
MDDSQSVKTTESADPGLTGKTTDEASLLVDAGLVPSSGIAGRFKIVMERFRWKHEYPTLKRVGSTVRTGKVTHVERNRNNQRNGQRTDA